MFVLIYWNADDNGKRYKAKRCYLLKGIVKNYNVIINGKVFYDQPIDPEIKWHEEIRKLTTAARWRIYYRMFAGLWMHQKNHYRLIAFDFSRQKELDSDPKAIQQIEFVGQLKK